MIIWRRASSRIGIRLLLYTLWVTRYILSFPLEFDRSTAIAVMETSPRCDGNGSIIFSEDITETEKEQLLELLPSSDSPLRKKKSPVHRLCYVIALLFLSNVALLAALLLQPRCNETAPHKSWMPPESS